MQWNIIRHCQTHGNGAAYVTERPLKPNQSIRALLFHNPSTTHSPVFPRVWQSSKIPNDYYNLRISSISRRVHDRIVAGDHQRSTNSISFPRSSLTVRDDRSHENSFEKGKKGTACAHVHAYVHTQTRKVRRRIPRGRASNCVACCWQFSSVVKISTTLEGSRLPSLFWETHFSARRWPVMYMYLPCCIRRK